MSNPYQVVRDLEAAVADYTGAPYVVAVNSCSMALLLAVAWHLREINPWLRQSEDAIRQQGPVHLRNNDWHLRYGIEIPKRTYVSVPMSIIHAGGRPTFRDEDWVGAYQLKPLPVWDSARHFTGGMYSGRSTLGGVDIDHGCGGDMVCVSFHASKTLGDTQGGAILHVSAEADKWLRRARFDGRAEGVAPKDDTFTQIGYHCYMSPDVAARLILKLHSLPRHNEPLPNDDYPDLSLAEAFK